MLVVGGCGRVRLVNNYPRLSTCLRFAYCYTKGFIPIYIAAMPRFDQNAHFDDFSVGQVAFE